VIFSNEDGGTPADRLMATWGRVTDIEYVYSVEIDAKGKVLAEEYQGPEHKLLAFAGRHEGRHPLEWVVTDNNMVSDKGTTEQRYALAPLFFDLENRSREAVMDANPWTYKVSDEEAQREGRIDESARPGGGKLPDPRRFLYLEACADLSDATLAFDVGLEETGGEIQWLPSDGGLEKFRIARAGCFQGAVAVPVDARGSVRAVRFRTYTRPAREGEAPLPKGTGKGRLLRVNRLFRLGPDHVPGEDLFRWAGDAALTPDGEPLVLPVNGQGQ